MKAYKDLMLRSTDLEHGSMALDRTYSNASRGVRGCRTPIAYKYAWDCFHVCARARNVEARGSPANVEITPSRPMPSHSGFQGGDAAPLDQADKFD